MESNGQKPGSVLSSLASPSPSVSLQALVLSQVYLYNILQIDYSPSWCSNNQYCFPPSLLINLYCQDDALHADDDPPDGPPLLRCPERCGQVCIGDLIVSIEKLKLQLYSELVFATYFAFS